MVNLLSGVGYHCSYVLTKSHLHVTQKRVLFSKMWHNCTKFIQGLCVHPEIETFLASIRGLHQLEPKNLPKSILHVMLKMSPEALFKICSQLAILRHNIPSKGKAVTLKEEEIENLAEAYLKAIIERLRTGA
jgi:hypothetical protein